MYKEAMFVSKAAFVAAESVFYDPSMLPLLYFPEEHVYAVFAPFFVPVALHALFALRKLVAGRRSRVRSSG